LAVGGRRGQEGVTAAADVQSGPLDGDDHFPGDKRPAADPIDHLVAAEGHRRGETVFQQFEDRAVVAQRGARTGGTARTGSAGHENS
jgi:hypothetical protein